MFKVRMQFFAALICLIMFGRIGVYAQVTNQNTQSNKNQGKQPTTFMDRAIEMNHAEIELAKLAATKAQDKRVKQFAQKLMHDHSQTLNRLHSASTSAGDHTGTREKPGASMTETDRSMLTREHQQKFDKLSKLSGAEFDKSFMDAMVREHRKAIEMFEREADQAPPQTSSQTSRATRDQSQSSASIARELLPGLRQHLAEAEQIQKQLQSANRH